MFLENVSIPNQKSFIKLSFQKILTVLWQFYANQFDSYVIDLWNLTLLWYIHESHMTVFWQIYKNDRFMTVIGQFNDRYMTVFCKWQFYDSFKTDIRQFYENHGTYIRQEYRIIYLSRPGGRGSSAQRWPPTKPPSSSAHMSAHGLQRGMWWTPGPRKFSSKFPLRCWGTIQ